MTVRYKRNRSPACYYEMNPSSAEKPEQIQRPCGPFKSCGDCPYATHGFLCYSREGDCLKTDMEKLIRRKKSCVQ